MLKGKFLFLPMCIFYAVFFSFASANAQSVSPESMVRDFAFESLGKAVFVTIRDDRKTPPATTVADPGGLILVLGEIDSDGARQIILELSQVYIGSAHFEALKYAVWRQGKKILPALRAMQEKTPNCTFLTKYFAGKPGETGIGCSDREERNRRVQRFIGLIISGEQLEYPL